MRTIPLSLLQRLPAALLLLLLLLAGPAAWAQPTITGFSPASGPAGTAVTVTGSGFSNVTSVRFGELSAAFTLNSSTQLTAIVPRAASTQVINVTTTAGSEISPTAFATTRNASLTYTLQASNFAGVNVASNAAPAVADLDGNNRLDLLVGRADGTIARYEQNAANGTAFTYVGLLTASGANIDRGANATVAIVDTDSNGKFSVLLGAADGFVYDYEQTAVGSATFGLVNSSVGNISTTSNSAPSVTNLDGDGRLELVTGKGDGIVSYAEQSLRNSENFVISDTNYQTLTSNSAPFCVDLDGNGLVDVLIGVAGGNIYRYEQSAANNPTLTQRTSVFNSINVGSNAKPCVTDIDGDGLLDLLIGRGDGTIDRYEQTPPANTAPTDISLSNASVAENQPVNTAVGTLSTTDANAGDTFTYTFASGGPDNGSFNIIGNTTLTTNRVFDFETKSSYTVRLRSTDQGGLFFVKDFTITVSDVSEPPTITGFTPTSGAVGTSVIISGNHFNDAGALTVKFNGTTATTVTVNNNTQLTATVPTGATTGTISVTNADGTGTSSAVFTVTVPTNTVLSSSLNPSVAGQSVTFTAIVSGNGGPPTGTVTFLDGSTTLGTGTLSGGVATFATTTLAAGTHSITAVYGGTAAFGLSTSAALSQVVNAPTAPNTTIVSGPPTIGNSSTVSFQFSSDQSPVDYTTSGAPNATYTGNGANPNFGPIPDGTYTLSVAAHNTSTGLTDQSPATYNFTIDTQRPTATISSSVGSSGASTATSPVPFTVTFSEPVTGFTLADITVSSGTKGSFVAVSSTQYTFSVTATTPATIAVNVAAGVAQDAATNTNTAAAAFSIQYAPAAPNTTIVSGPPTIGNSSTVSFAFSSDQSPVDYTTTGNPAFAYTGNGANSSFGPVPDGTYTLSAAAHNTTTNLTDQSPATYTFTVDTQRPSATVTSTAGSSGGSTLTTPIPFTVTFSENVLNFINTDVTVTGGTLTSFSAASGSVYNLTVTPTGPGSVVAVSIAANVANDAASNQNTVSNTYTLTYAPGPVISSFNPTTGTAGTTVIITGTGFTGATAVAFNGTAAASFTVNSATQITAVVGAGTTTGTISVTTPSGTATSTGVFTVPVNQAPVVTVPATQSTPQNTAKVFSTANGNAISVADADAGSGQLYVYLAAGNGAITLGSTASVTISNGTNGSGGFGITGTLTAINNALNGLSFSPNSGFLGAGNLQVTANDQGNTGSGGAKSDSKAVTINVVDAQRPSVVVTSTAGSSGGSTVTSPIPFVITFSENVTGFGLSGVTVTGGTFTANAVSGSVYNVQVTPSAPGSVVTVSVAANVAQDAAGNQNTASNTYTLTYTPAPVITSLTPSSGPVGTSVVIAGSSFTGTTSVTFNGTAAASFTVNSGSQITALVAAGTSTGAVVVTTPSGTSNTNATFTVTAANTSTALSSSVNPSVFGQSVSFTATVSNTNGSATPAGAVTFKDGAATLGTVTLNGSGVATLSTSTLAAGIYSITAVYSPATGFNASTSAVVNQVVNPAATNTTLSSSLNPSTFGQSVTFTAAVAAMAPGSGTPTGTVTFKDGTATLGTGTLSGGVATYATSTLAVGSHSITAVYGTAINYAASTSAALTQVVNPAAPVVVSVAVPANGTYRLGQNLNFTVTFDQAVTVSTTGGTPGLPLTVGSTARNAAYLSGSGSTALVFRYVVVAPDLDTDGIALGSALALNGGTIRNATSTNATLTLNGVPTTTGVLVDGVVPTASVITTAASPSSTSLLPITITFSEPVTGLTAAGIAVTNGTKGTLSSSGTTYTLNVTATASGPVTVQVSAAAAQDAAGNPNLASNTLSVTYAPPAVAISSFTPTSGAAGTVVVITGTGFSGATSVTINNVAVASYTVDSNTQITATVAAGNTTGLIQVVAPAGTGTSNTNFVVGPAVTGVTASANGSYKAGQTISFFVTFSQAVTVTGAPSLGLTVGSTARTLAYASGSGTTTLTFSYVVVAGDLDPDGVQLSSGAIALNGGTIRNSSGADAALDLTNVAATTGLLVDAVRPTVAISSPAASPTNATPIPVTVTFSESVTGFPASGIAVTNGSVTGGSFGGSGTTYTFTVTPTAAGVVTVNVPANAAQDAATNGNVAAPQFSITYAPAPAITSLTPNNGPVGTSVVIAGSNLDGATSVSFNGTSQATITASSAGSLTVVVPAGASTGPLTVTTPNGTSNGLTFTVTAATTSTTLASSANPSALSQAVTFTATVANTNGSALPTGTVTFMESSTTLGSGPLDASGQATFTTSALGAGSHAITATYGGTADFATSTSAVLTQVVNAAPPAGPTVTSFSAGAELPGMPVVITGTGFTSGSTVSFGGVAATSVTFNSSTSLTAVVPAGAAVGSSVITVTTPGGSSSSAPAFAVLEVYNGGAPDACTTALPATATTGDGTWHYLLSSTGQVVLAYNYTGASLGSFAADVLRANPANPVRQDVSGRPYLDRNFHLTASGGSFTGRSVQVRLYGLTTEFDRLHSADASATLAGLKATQYSGPNEDCDLNNDSPSGEKRVLATASSTPGNGVNWFVSTLTVADHFSEFFLSNAAAPLPVQLVSFSAERKTNAVALAWRTASEVNSARFEVERSADGVAFASIGQVVAAGSKTTATDYAFLDAQPLAALTYYRLRQVDVDGTAAYSPVRSVAAGAGELPALAAYPVPARAGQLLAVAYAPAGATVEVLDAVGRRVATATAAADGTAALNLPRELPTGVYVLRSGGQARRLVVE